MRKIAIVLSIMLAAGMATAGPIYDVEVNGLYAEGDYVLVECATVTAVTDYGVAIAEAPFQMGNSIWVYAGSGHGLNVGDIVTVNAPYTEYYDLTELDYGHNTETATLDVVGVCTTMPDPIYITAAEIMANPEHYESCMVFLTDGFHVTEFFSYGEWAATSHEDGTVIRFDDYWFDDTTLAVDDCANWAVGMWTYSYGIFELHPQVDGFPLVDCTVATEDVTMDQVKALYR